MLDPLDGGDVVDGQDGDRCGGYAGSTRFCVQSGGYGEDSEVMARLILMMKILVEMNLIFLQVQFSNWDTFISFSLASYY